MKKIIDIINISTGKLDSNAANENGQYPFFTCAPEPSKISSFAYDLDCILLTGNNASGNFKAFRYNGRFNAYQRVYIITLKDKNYSLDFIYYNILQNLGVLKKRAQGSQTKFLTLSEISNFEITELSLKEQEDIALNLTTFDNYIKSNNKIISELQELSKFIYNYWFVQFDFPNDEGKPYKSSGGKMVWNEELKREVPEGWEVKNISELVIFGKGYEPGSDNYYEVNSGDLVPFYRVGELNSNKPIYIPNYGFNSESKAIFGDIIVSFDGSVGRVSISSEGVYSTGIKKVISTQDYISNSMVYSMVNSDYFQSMIKQHSTGSIIKHATNSIQFIKFPVKKNIFSKYSQLSLDTYKMIVNLHKENLELENQRDFLLPLLMNGQVKIQDEE